MRTSTLLASSFVVLALASPVLAGPPAQDVHYDGVATITDSNTLLQHDGRASYGDGARDGNVFVQDDADPESEDLFGLYVSRDHTFSITFGDTTRECVGYSHVFFDSPDFWGATDAVGDQALGSVGIWCDQGDNTAYAVRYPGNPRTPQPENDEPDDDCNVVTRLEDNGDGGREYRIATPAAEPAPEPGLLDGVLAPEPESEQAPCPATVFHVTDVNNAQRAHTQEWQGEAAFEVLVSLKPDKPRRSGR